MPDSDPASPDLINGRGLIPNYFEIEGRLFWAASNFLQDQRLLSGEHQAD